MRVVSLKRIANVINVFVCMCVAHPSLQMSCENSTYVSNNHSEMSWFILIAVSSARVSLHLCHTPVYTCMAEHWFSRFQSCCFYWLFVAVGMQSRDVCATPYSEDGAGLCCSFAFKVIAFKVTPKQHFFLDRPQKSNFPHVIRVANRPVLAGTSRILGLIYVSHFLTANR